MLSVTEYEQKALYTLTINIIGSLLLSIAGNYLSKEPAWLKYGFLGCITIAVFLFAFLIASWAIRFAKTKNTFWNLLSPGEKKTIDNYLFLSIETLKYELNFNMKDDYVSLSGNTGNPNGLMPQQAYEEKGSSSRIRIDNLDNYLLFPSSPRVFLYGPPGSGKSTTLYKALINYSQKFYRKSGDFIPVFMHANDIEAALDSDVISTGNKIFSLVKLVGQRNFEGASEYEKFISLCSQKPSLRFVIIVDALDEFLDKERRGKLFRFLSSLMKSDKNVRWVLSCREEEYKAYSKSLSVTNIKIKAMNMSQVEKLLRKRLKSYLHDPRTQNKIRKTIMAIVSASRGQEAFLRNPYYLSLWLERISMSTSKDDTDDSKRRIPSIEELHNSELRREIAKGQGLNPEEASQLDESLLQSQLEILSVLSFHLLKESLSSTTYSTQQGSGVSFFSFDVLRLLARKYSYLKKSGKIDTLACERLEKYRKYRGEFDSLTSIYDDECTTFLSILGTFTDGTKSIKVSSSEDSKNEFLIAVSSIIDQAYRYRLIELDISSLNFSSFLNQRAGDYLAARFLKENGLEKVLRTKNVNFWLFRTIAIAIAISKNPQSMLDPSRVSEDPVLATAVVNGLALVKSDDRKKLGSFTQEFVAYLLLENKFSSLSPEYDVCYPLRALKVISRLSSNGYAHFFFLPPKVFRKLLGASDTSISDAAAITLLTHASRRRFDASAWGALFKYFFRKALRFELSRKSLSGFSTAIYNGVIGEV